MSEYHLDLWMWLNSVQMRTPTGSRWMSNNYITRWHRRLGSVSQFESVRVQFQWQLGTRCRSESQRQTEGLRPPGPTGEQPSRMRKKCCDGQRDMGSICGSLSPAPTHLSHITNINPFATLSRIKCERYIFLKKLLLIMKLVDKFTYLGDSVSSTEKDIDPRLTKAWTAIDRLSIMWKSDLTDKIKRSFFQAAVVSILLYGCTTWTLTKRLEKKLDGNYTRML